MGDPVPSKSSTGDDEHESDTEQKLKNRNDSEQYDSTTIANIIKLSDDVKTSTADNIEIPEGSSSAGEESSNNTNSFAVLRRISQGANFVKKRREPMFMTFRSRQRPRQPFMNQTSSGNSAPPPRPPPYYSNGVTPEQHRPERIRAETETSQEEQRHGRQSQENQNVRSLPRSYLNDRSPVPSPFFPSFALWAPYPDRIPSSIPACLAHLYTADSLFIIQQINFLDLMVSAHLPNFYLIQNKAGQIIYYVYETNNLCLNCCCSASRGFQLHVMDMYNNEVIYMNRPCGCSNFPCCYPVMEVYSPPLVPIGAVMQVFNTTKNEISVIDPDENLIFKIYGPIFFNICACCVEVDFTIHAVDQQETKVGIIRREWGGFVRTFIAETDMYGITFPQDLDVRIKAVFLGALFFINLKRTGWVLRNVEDPETVSGHMYRMSVMTFLIPETSGVDKTRCMKLSIVHDLAECIVGDLTPFCGVDANEKHRQEDAAMKELTQMIGDSGAEIYKLYKEYEAQVTDESKFVKDLDRLDMILQAFEYEKVGDRPGKLEEFFASTLNKFHFPWTIDIVKEIYKQRNLHIKKDKV